MAKLTPSRFWIDDTPGEFVPGHVLDVRLTRGWDYHVFKLRCREGWRCDEELQQKQNPVTLKFECAAENVTQATSFEFRNWYILSRRALEWGWVEYEFADVRWHKRHNKLTRQFNIDSYGGKYRKDSLKGGTSPWTCVEALKESLIDMGYDVSIDPKLPAHLKTEALPDNLGNSEGGGFFAAEQQMFGPLMAEPIRCDIAPTPEGGLVITDRVREQSEDLKGYIHIGGQVREADVHWQKPKKLIIEYQMRVERKATLVEGGTSAPNPLSPALENVIPNWSTGAADPPTEFREFTAWLAAQPGPLALTLAQIYELFMAPTLYDTQQRNISRQTIDDMRTIEGLTREHWRHTMRFVVRASTIDDIRARYALIEIGRMAEDGTNKADGAVIMDYWIDLRYGQRKGTESVATSKFSENIAYALGRPAPFTAQWLDRGELIFKLVQNQPKAHHRAYYPGGLEAPKCYGDFFASKTGGKIRLDSNCKLSSDFTLSVYWHGLFVGAGGFYETTHKVECPLYSDGEVESLTLRCDDMTANFGYVEATGVFPGQLKNAADLNARAQEMRDEVKPTFEQGRAGVMRHGGLDVLANGGFRVGGDIHEIAVLVGARAAHSIDTHITVLPGRRVVRRTITGDRRGKKPREIL